MNECIETSVWIYYRPKYILFLAMHFNRNGNISREEKDRRGAQNERYIYIYISAHKMSWISHLLWHNAFENVRFFMRRKLCWMICAQWLSHRYTKRTAFLWFSSEMTHFMAQTELHSILRQLISFTKNRKDLKSCNHLSMIVSFATHQRYICKINLPNSSNRWLVTRVNAYESPHNQLDTFVRCTHTYIICIYFYLMSNKRFRFDKKEAQKKKEKSEVILRSDSLSVICRHNFISLLEATAQRARQNNWNQTSLWTHFFYFQSDEAKWKQCSALLKRDANAT